MVVKTVSNKIESVEKISRAEVDDMILFFLHEAEDKIMKEINVM